MKWITISNFLLVGQLFLVMLSKAENVNLEHKLICKGKPADIVFVLDSSSSIWSEHFQKQLDFVNYMIDHLDIGIGPKQVRIGVETFSDFASIHLHLNNFLHKNNLKSKIKEIPQILGNTSIGDGLKKLRTTMFTPVNGARAGVRRVGIILTDGASQDEAMTQREARQCRNTNIELFVIGIGHYISRSELEGIASKPISKYLFYTPSYEALDKIRDEVIKQTCIDVKPELLCRGKPADIVFVLDSSSSIWREHFQKELDFVKHMVDSLDIGSGPKQVRVGIQTFSDAASIHMNLNNAFEKKVLKWKVDQIPQILGNTSIGDALKKLRKIMMTTINGARSGVRHVAIIITDGTSQDEAMTQREAKECRNNNIELFVIGIGHYISRQELKGMASRPTSRHLFFTPSFETLDHIRDEVIRKTCTDVVQPPKPTTERPPAPPACGHRIEIVFMIHNIYFGLKRTNLLLNVSDEIMRQAAVYKNFHFGRIFDECPAYHDLTVGSTMGQLLHNRHLDNIQFNSIAPLFRKLRDELFSDFSFHTRRAGLVFLDDEIDLDRPDVLNEVKRIMFDRIDLYAVVIGDVDQDLVKKLLVPKDHIIRMYSDQDLMRYLPALFIETMCDK